MFKKAFNDLKRVKYVDWHWLVIWALIYVSFISLDIFFPHFRGTALIKYIGIFLCTIYAYQKYRSDTLLILALLFTFLADTVLVWTPWAIPGVYIFCFAQYFHLSRFTKGQPKSLITFFLITFLIFVAGTIQGFPPIYVIAAVYASLLIINLSLTISWYRHDKNNFHARCAMYGFILFICCDICVGIQFLTYESVFPAAILPVVSFLVWLFYYPSQVLISNSSNLPIATKHAKKPIEAK